MRVRRFLPLILLLMATLLLAGCNRRFLSFPEEDFGQIWFPSPNVRFGLQLVENPRRSVREVWFRDRYREGHDQIIDEFAGPAGILWSPDGDWLAINHSDYRAFEDFRIFRIHRRQPVFYENSVARVQALWERVFPDPMDRLSFRAARWDADEERVLILGFGDPVGSDQIVRQAMWLSPEDGVVRLGEADEETWGRVTPFRR